MRHERPDARRRSAVRAIGDGSADDESIDDGPTDDETTGDGLTDDESADQSPVHDRNEDLPDDPDRVRRQIRNRAERIERDEVERAVSSLEARGGLTDEQRETVRLLGAAIVRGVTAPPESALELGRDEPATVRAVARLFDVESE